MSNAAAKPGPIILVVRWLARVWSIISVGLLLLFFIGEGFDPAQITFFEWIGLLFFPLGVSVGLIMAWRWEVAGGRITIGSFLAFYTEQYLTSGRFPGGPYFALIAAPGIFFVVCWLKSNHLERRQRLTERTSKE